VFKFEVKNMNRIQQAIDEMNRILKIFTGLLCITLLCSTAMAFPFLDYGDQETEKIVYRGELVGKRISQNGGQCSVAICDEDGAVHYNLNVSKRKCTGSQIGKDYEWKRVINPDGTESVSFHRI